MIPTGEEKKPVPHSIRRTHRPTTIAAILVGLLAIGGCAGGTTPPASTPSQFPVTVTNCGRQVTIPKAPARVLTNGTFAVNLVAAAGGADRIVARAGEYGAPLSDLAKGIAGVPIVAKDNTVSVEQIIESRVDLNIVRPGDIQQEVLDQLSAAGVTTLFPSGYCSQLKTADNASRVPSFADVYADIELYGRLLGSQDKAAAAVADLRNRVTTFQSQAARGPSRTVAELQFFGGVPSGYGSGGMANTQMSILGLKNVFADRPTVSFQLNVEELIARDPDVVILQLGYGEGKAPGQHKTLEDAKQELLAVPGIDKVKAVQTGAILGIPTTQIQADPLAVDGLKTLADQLGNT